METSILILKLLFEDHFNVSGKYRVGRIVSISEEATTNEIEENLPKGYSFASEKHLLGYKSSWRTQKRGTVIALGSIGPHPYSGNPGWTVEGEIKSFGIPSNHLKWGKGSLFLLMRDEVVLEDKKDILKLFLGTWNQSYKESTLEATFNEGDEKGERTALIFSVKVIGENVKCTFSYTDNKSELKGPYNGMIPIKAFSKVIV